MWFKHMASLSESPFVLNLEAEFGLVGFARYVKVMEQCAKAGTNQIAHSWLEWEQVLSGKREALGAFFDFCHRHGGLVVESGDDAVTVEVVDLSLSGTPGNPPHVFPPNTLFTFSDQWANWLVEAANLSQRMINAKGSDRVFRRWLASNVSVGEVLDVLETAKEQDQAVESLGALHELIAKYRKRKLQDAERC